jgi:hypothetical protein
MKWIITIVFLSSFHDSILINGKYQHLDTLRTEVSFEDKQLAYHRYHSLLEMQKNNNQETKIISVQIKEDDKGK